MKKDDIVTEAIAKAKIKLEISEEEKIASYIQSLYTRFNNAYKRLNDAKAENSDQVDVLQRSVDKLKYEIDNHRKMLKKLKADVASTSSKPEKPTT